MSIRRESVFEDAIEASLIEDGGYEELLSEKFDADLGLFPSAVVDFLEASQPEKWRRLAEQYGEAVGERVVAQIARDADQHGMLHVLRHGVIDRGVHLELVFFRPVSGLNPSRKNSMA